MAETIQRVDPDVVLINEFDYDRRRRSTCSAATTSRWARTAPTRSATATRYVAPSNTGVPSGHDLDNNGSVGGGNDAFGFGEYVGQYGMVVYSKYPINTREVRTFQKFEWADMPGAMLPDDPATPAPADWY